MTPREIDCEQALRRLFEFVDQELTAGERDSMERHIGTCKSCFSRVEFERRLKLRLRELRDRNEAAVARTERIRKLLDSF